jgi:hypothetical protein
MVIHRSPRCTAKIIASTKAIPHTTQDAAWKNIVLIETKRNILIIEDILSLGARPCESIHDSISKPNMENSAVISNISTIYSVYAILIVSPFSREFVELKEHTACSFVDMRRVNRL